MVRPRRSRPQWLTVRDVGVLLQVSEGTVRRWIRTEKLVAHFFGGRTGYRIRGADLRKFLRQPVEGPKKKRTGGGISVATSQR